MITRIRTAGWIAVTRLQRIASNINTAIGIVVKIRERKRGRGQTRGVNRGRDLH